MIIYATIVYLILGFILFLLGFMAYDYFAHDCNPNSKANRKKWGIENDPNAKIITIAPRRRKRFWE